MSSSYYIGVDVGTASVRAGLVTVQGEVVHTAIKSITIKNTKPGFYEQSAAEIWDAVVETVGSVVSQGNVSKENVKGIGFDATCSLVLEDQEGKALPLSEDGDFNIIMWMDHRANAEATLINSTKHEILNYVGGKVSLEMQLPKLLWLKRNNPDLWKKAGAFYDLPDWLTYKATGTPSRSFCSVVCKWNYFVPDASNLVGWDSNFFKTIGLEDLEQNCWTKIGDVILPPGHRVDNGLSREAATSFGLEEKTAVGASLIDAHAGALGMLKSSSNVVGSLGLVSGTSTCHMLLSDSFSFVPGVWGPYYSAIIEGLWLIEGGQSATGSLLDHIITTHPAYPHLANEAIQANCNIFELLESEIQSLSITKGLDNYCYLTKDFHMTVDFHGNRSPLSDANMTGSMIGLTLTEDKEKLVTKYLATLQGICYGTKAIIESIVASGHLVNVVTVCGGISKSPVFLQTLSDVLDLEVRVPEERESVLLGSAMLGMSAFLEKPLQEIVSAMKGNPTVIQSSKDQSVLDYHGRKFRVYQATVADQLKYRDIMHQ